MFTTTALTGNQVLVEGTDIRNHDGQQVVDATQWNNIKSHDTFQTALDAVDDAIAALIAPITEAAKAANKALEAPAMDPLLYVTETEEVEGVEAQRGITTKLNEDSVILRAIEEGFGDRLIWINGSLVLTAATGTTEAPAVHQPTLEEVLGEATYGDSVGDAFTD